ncbi:MAG: hypothetical protein GEV10_09955 [Streptosporangiales bacterium]|nr:hypothetical protein [Streptosporangiales bacterium]
MDEKETARRAKALPDRFADRVGDELSILRSHAAGGEWGELVDDLLATLAKHKAPVTPAERDELRALAEATGEGGKYVDGLTVQA